MEGTSSTCTARRKYIMKRISRMLYFMNGRHCVGGIKNKFIYSHRSSCESS